MIRLQLFGRFRVEDDRGNEIPIKSRKARALLAYLASPLGKPRSREAITALLWCDRGDEQARGSLRQALSGLRRDLGDVAAKALLIADDDVALNPEHVALANPSAGDDFLEGLGVNDPAFDEWLRDERLKREAEGQDEPEQGPPPLPQKPSIAVLPFVNLSNDPEQEFFADGITEDIISELSRFQILSVIARQSAFALKGEKTSVEAVGAKLGVDYIVEGSVRRAGNRARMTAQLVEIENGSPIWAERYDRNLEDIFEVQDEVTRSIVAAVAAQLGKDVAEKASRKPASNIRSYEFFLQGNQHYYRFTPEENSAAARLYQKAIDFDPGFARSYAGLANTCTTDHFLHWGRIDNALQTGLECARKCLELDSNDPLGRAISAWALIGFQLWEEAEAELDRALARKPGDPDIIAEVGHGLYVVGRPEEGIPLLEEAVRLNPLYPDVYLRWLGIGYYRGERYREAAKALSGARLEGWGHGWLAAAYARLGDKTRAQAAMARFLELRRKELGSAGATAGSVQDLLGNYQSNFRHEAEWEHFLNGLREAGLPQ